MLSALPYAMCALLGAAAAVLFMLRLGKHRRRQLQRTLAVRELALLDARSDTQRVAELSVLDEKREAVLALAMDRLEAVDQACTRLQGTLSRERQQHKTQVAELTTAVAQARSMARKAALLARKAATHLKRLESVAPATQTITAHEPKSYGAGEAHTVSVVDQATVEARRDAITRVSNRDSARLARLHSSNENRRVGTDNLQSIEGISAALEKRLKAIGIHRVEQLANLSDSEADALDRQLAGTARPGRSAALQLDARKWLEHSTPG